MHSSRIRCSVSVLALAACQSVHAQPNVVAQASTPGGFQLNSGPVGPVTATAAYNEAFLDAPGATGAAGANGLAHGFGYLRASSSVQQSGGWTTHQGFRASADAAMNDDLLITPANPALLGTGGTLSITVSVTGSLTTGFSGSNWVETSFDAPAAAGGIVVYLDSSYYTSTNDYVLVSGVGPQSQSMNVNRMESINIPFTYGQYFNLHVSLSVISGIESYSPQPGVASAYAAASDWVFRWGGVTGVTSIDGPLGAGAYQLTSYSGTDYNNAIPSPAAAPLLCALGLAATARRRR